MGIHEPLNSHFWGTFSRLLRIYPTLNILSALMSGLSIASLTLPEFHPIAAQNPVPASQVPIYTLAEGFFTSAAACSVISIMLCTMLQFCFESRVTATRLDLVLLWSPLVLLDWSIVAFLLGLLVWYGEKNEGWRTIVMGAHVAVLLTFGIGTSAWMWTIMKPGGRLERMMTEREKRRMEEGHPPRMGSDGKSWTQQLEQQHFAGPQLPPGYGPEYPLDHKWSQSETATLAEGGQNRSYYYSPGAPYKFSPPMGSGDWCLPPHGSPSMYGNQVTNGKQWSPTMPNRGWTASPPAITEEEQGAEKTAGKASEKQYHMYNSTSTLNDEKPFYRQPQPRRPLDAARRQQHFSENVLKKSEQDSSSGESMAAIVDQDEISREKTAAVQQWAHDREQRTGNNADAAGSGSGSGSGSTSAEEDDSSESGSSNSEERTPRSGKSKGDTMKRRGKKGDNSTLPPGRFRLQKKTSTGLSQATTIVEEQ
ncbi:MAG: Dicer-like protein 2 [Chaenotheca gracillima]|nr:MAG: Dicer-like protein 2 [Chaenotheca gracillima]